MSEALDSFVAAAADHGRHTLEGDARKTNAAFKKLHRAREALRANGDGGPSSLIALLFHGDASVRIWAALYLLPSNEGAALAVIDAVGKGEGLIALGARMTAREWRAGRLEVR